MKLYVIPNLSKDRYIKTAVECINALISNNIDCHTSKGDSIALRGTDELYAKPDECDVIASIGGDGAVLKASHTAIKHGKPLLGINGGRLGYLCAFETSDAKKITEDSILSLKASERSIIQSNSGDIAINDIVVAKGDYGSILTLRVMCDGEEIMSFRGDGVIISTPTGSTSYNMSARGPALLPQCRCLVITPICPHLSCAGPVVVPDTCSITVSVSDRSQTDAFVYFDGVKSNDRASEITVKSCERKLILLSESDVCANKEKLKKTFI